MNQRERMLNQRIRELQQQQNQVNWQVTRGDRVARETQQQRNWDLTRTDRLDREAQQQQNLGTTRTDRLAREQLSEAARQQTRVDRLTQNYLSNTGAGTAGQALGTAAQLLGSNGNPYLAAAVQLGGVLASVTGDPIDGYKEWRKSQQDKGLMTTWLSGSQSWKDYVDIFPAVTLPDLTDENMDPDALYRSRHVRADNLISFAEGCVREAKLRWLSNTAVTDTKG